MAGKQDSLIGRMFRHFKGNLYRLEGFAKDSETLEEMVVYRALYGDGGLWVRSASCDRFAAQSLRSFGQPDACGAGESAKMFFETVERDGKTMKRFETQDDDRQGACGGIRHRRTDRLSDDEGR